MWTFILAHQAFLWALAATAGPALFNWLCKPRTEEQYQAYSPRVAAVFRFMAATFPDPDGVLRAIYQAWKNTHELPPRS